MSPGASLDAAISGLTSRVESARRTASELSAVSENGTPATSDASNKTDSGDGKGSIIDVTA
jgi:hypothetical protein